MEYIFTESEQLAQFQLGKDAFNSGDYENSVQILQVVSQSALQYEDYNTYVEVLIWMNRGYINTSNYDLLNRSLVILSSYIPKYGNEEMINFYHLQTIIFNKYYSINNPQIELERLFNTLKSLNYPELLFITGGNLLLSYVENGHYQKAISLSEELQKLKAVHSFENKMTLYIQQIYLFLAYYFLKELNECEKILSHLKKENCSQVVESFRYMFDICTALLFVAKGEITQAKILFDQTLESMESFVHIRMELKLWIEQMKEYDLKDEVIYYQQLLLEEMENMYAVEVSEVRRKSIEEKSKQFYEAQLYIDPLTGVKNRAFYEQLLSKQLKVKNYTLGVLDIDRFKSINDTYGHVTGDEAIKFIGKLLSNYAPKHDIEIVRYGGDEFILLIPYSFEVVQEHINYLHEMIVQTPFRSDKMKDPIYLSISIGCCYTNDEYTTIDQLFEQADEAIYEAKKVRGEIQYKQYTSK